MLVELPMIRNRVTDILPTTITLGNARIGVETSGLSVASNIARGSLDRHEDHKEAYGVQELLRAASASPRRNERAAAPQGPLTPAFAGSGCPVTRLSAGFPRRSIDCRDATSEARRSSLDLTSLSLSGTVGTVGPVHSAPREIPESRSSLDPSLSQGGDALGPGSCLIPWSANSALAASLSPMRDLCLSLWGRLLFAAEFCELTTICGPSSPLPEDSSKGD